MGHLGAAPSTLATWMRRVMPMAAVVVGVIPPGAATPERQKRGEGMSEAAAAAAETSAAGRRETAGLQDALRARERVVGRLD
mmetsp:Transcript_124058/g.277296  ORF Transcript_124058/g.277296 Transcript_124058/m.277296 type:complete len:82 (-) Transcript_124058:35-280(-)